MNHAFYRPTRPSRSFDRKTFHTARRDRREEISRKTMTWVLVAAVVSSVLIILSGCGGRTSQSDPQYVNPCPCSYELILTPVEMKTLCKPCPPVVQ